LVIFLIHTKHPKKASIRFIQTNGLDAALARSVVEVMVRRRRHWQHLIGQRDV